MVPTASNGVKVELCDVSKEERMRRAVWLFVFGVLLPCAVAAQETRGNITGVTDQSGVGPGAMVRVTPKRVRRSS